MSLGYQLSSVPRIDIPEHACAKVSGGAQSFLYGQIHNLFPKGGELVTMLTNLALKDEDDLYDYNLLAHTLIDLFPVRNFRACYPRLVLPTEFVGRNVFYPGIVCGGVHAQIKTLVAYGFHSTNYLVADNIYAEKIDCYDLGINKAIKAKNVIATHFRCSGLAEVREISIAGEYVISSNFTGYGLKTKMLKAGWRPIE